MFQLRRTAIKVESQGSPDNLKKVTTNSRIARELQDTALDCKTPTVTTVALWYIGGSGGLACGDGVNVSVTAEI
jgi:hypothetical protein